MEREGGAQVFDLFRQSEGISEGSEIKIRISGGEERFMILEFRGHGGGIFNILEYPKQGR